MLSEWAKNEQDEQKANDLKRVFPRHGCKGVDINNFLDLHTTHISYNLCGTKYHGYFTRQQVDDLFLILNYFEGRIIGMAG